MPYPGKLFETALPTCRYHPAFFERTPRALSHLGMHIIGTPSKHQRRNTPSILLTQDWRSSASKSGSNTESDLRPPGDLVRAFFALFRADLAAIQKTANCFSGKRKFACEEEKRNLAKNAQNADQNRRVPPHLGLALRFSLRVCSDWSARLAALIRAETAAVCNALSIRVWT